MKIGVLALQGAFIEHEMILKKLGCEVAEIRQLKDLTSIEGLVLPGGESTVQGQLLLKLGLLEPLKERITKGLPVLATCAGLILLAQQIETQNTNYLGTLPVTIRRNAFGRQISSFQANAAYQRLDTFPMTFIRAPYITKAADEVQILATVNDHIVAVQWHNQIGLAFHPELTDDTRIHEEFLKLSF